MSGDLTALHVVIPVHQEEQLLGRQLAAVARAAGHVARDRPQLRLSTTVVLDDCDDGSRDVAAAFAGVTVLPVRLRCVGAARARGVERARRLGSDRAERTWVACTDADSEVPRHWLSTQLDLASHGVDLVLGTVTPEPGQLTLAAYGRWHAGHRLLDGHPHVHGANLGFRLAAYDAVGGFRDLPHGEDVDLATRMSEAGARVARTSTHPVLTSARLDGRAPAGFASYLTAL